MLEMRPDCERCGRDLPPGNEAASICSFECTFCNDCAAELKGTCPNCGGGLVRRPARAEALLERYPGSTERRFRN
ncbi:MAG TPA: DUF1272 domain-containing protein [Allosphingosinicella sp.]|jgi:hypothetical protein|uniref:DUF1272 domain-containing protein n=1 Tax=Allosphingosinicella sp. TaxID=2823234 RepID=UPI002F298B0A